MVKSIMIVALLCGACWGVDISPRLIEAIGLVESTNRDNAVGDNGRAVGRYQIWMCVVEDVYQITKVRFRPEDRNNHVLARYMLVTYLRHYGRAYERKTGRPATDEVLARIWNGGPAGYKKPATEKYWHKVRQVLK